MNNLNYTFETASNVQHSIKDFQKVEFSSENNLDLGFYKGEVWIKLDISNDKQFTSAVVLCNDLINHYYRFYKLDTLTKSFKPVKEGIDTLMNDHRSDRFAKPNFKIDLQANEKATYLITTSSDGRILQASPKLISVEEFHEVKQQILLFDLIFYFSVSLLLIINLFYFRLIRNDIYYFYGAYILFGCLMYLFVEGRLYGLGWSHAVIDHLMFISIRLWILTSFLFTLNFLETKSTNPKYYKFTLSLLLLYVIGTTLYQLVFSDFSISTLHQYENITGFIWIILSLMTFGIAYKKRKIQSIYYLISFSAFLFFVALGLIDSHTTMLPGDPFSYFKIGTILEFIGFTYFITILVKQKISLNEKLENELSENRSILEEKEKQLASKSTSLVGVFKLIENSLSTDSDWNNFKENFEKEYPNFINDLLERHPDLTKSEIRLLTLIRIGYSQKEIADILNIAPDSVKKARSRVRKKLELEEEEGLNSYLLMF